MSQCKYVKEIESLRFQIQFSVVGGIEILQLAMERHPTLVALRSEISRSAESADAVFERIVLLLGRVATEIQLSYDESIAAYLFCLSKENPVMAYRASWRILDHGGLWWSVQLAHHVAETSRQILESIDTSDSESESVSVGSTDSNTTTGVQILFVVYDSKELLRTSHRAGNIVVRPAAPSRLRFRNKTRAALSTQKTFEINTTSERHLDVSLSR